VLLSHVSSPTGKSPKWSEEGGSSHQEYEGLQMGDNNNKIDATITTFVFLIDDIRGEAQN